MEVNKIDHPKHYMGEYECIDYMRAIYGDEAVKNFCICNAYKYRFRAGKKTGETYETDIKKAEWYENYIMSNFRLNITPYNKENENILYLHT